MQVMLFLVLLFLSIALLAFIHVCVIGRAFRRAVHADGQVLTSGTIGDGVRSTTLSKEDLESIPCFDYTEPEIGSSIEDCAVCLENFKVGDICRFLPNCNHKFHAQCIDAWLMKAPICPICRTKVAPLKTDVVNEENHISIQVNDAT